MKKYIVIILWILGWQTILFAENIDNYKVDIIIEPEGTLFVSERLTYNFGHTSKHGIFRDIPFLTKIDSVTKDIGLYDFFVQMDGDQVKWEKSKENTVKSGNVIRIKIGSSSKTISGIHTYVISYRVKSAIFSVQTEKSSNFIRWNIIGTGWEIPIKSIEANIYLPSTLSRQDISLSTYTGSYGSVISNASTQWLNNSYLQMKLAHLDPYEGFTVEMIFPKGKLEPLPQNNFFEWIFRYWFWSIVLVILLYSGKIYKKYSGFVDRRSIAVQYYPPKDMSVLESGLILDKFTKHENFAAAIIELAQQKYLKIVVEKGMKKPILHRTDKSDSELSSDQQFLLRYIFFNWGKRIYSFSEVSRFQAKTLRNGFKEIRSDLYSWAMKEGLILENLEKLRESFYWRSIFYFVPLVLLMVVGINYTAIPDNDLVLSSSLLFGVIGLFICCFTTALPYKFLSFFLIVVSIFFPLEILKDIELVRKVIIEPLVVVFISILILYITYKNIGGYTQKGAAVKKHLLGLEEFIKRVKKDEIKRRLEEDPLYLEKLLPYAMLFGQTKHWLSFFPLMNVDTPYWYDGDINKISGLSSGLNSISAIASPSTSSMSSGSSSGGSSGGGSGGFSGGGSGSW